MVGKWLVGPWGTYSAAIRGKYRVISAGFYSGECFSVRAIHVLGENQFARVANQGERLWIMA